MSLKSYMVRRVLYAVPTILIMIIVNFMIIHITPGDPVTVLTGETGIVSEEYINILRHKFGLDQPIHVQLLLYIKGVLSGDFGYSFRHNMPVIDVIFSRIPATLLLMTTAIILSTLIGVFLGMYAAKNRGTLVDFLCSIVGLFGFSIPMFWLGLILILVFAVWLHLLPATGIAELRIEQFGPDYLLSIIRHMILPVITLSVWYLAVVAQLTRSKMAENLEADYIVTGRAKGLSEETIVYKHALPNSLFPVITVVGMNFGYVLGGSVTVEAVFGWPGLGRLIMESISCRDYPVLMGILLFSSLLVIFFNIVTDMLYHFLDPRVRFGRSYR